MVADTNNARIGGHPQGQERQRRFSASNEEHLFAGTGPDRINRDKGFVHSLTRGGQWLHEEQRRTFQPGVLSSGNHRANHAGELHICLDGKTVSET